MAKLKLIETIQTKLSTLTKTDGQLIVIRDNASLYVDLDGTRIYISDWIDVETDTDRLAMLTPLNNKYYYVVENNKIWRYISGSWILISSIQDLNKHIEDTDIHITSTERTNWNDANSKKHSHSNKSVLDATTASYTTEEKNKLSGIATGANNYNHPSHTAKTNGLYKVTVDSLGHVSATTEVAKSDITSLGIPTQDTTYDAAGSSLGLVKSGGDVTISSGVITVNDNSHNHSISNVADLQTALDSTIKLAARGTVIPSGSDLDAYTTPGNYFSENAAKSETLTNAPFSKSGFRLIVSIGYVTTVIHQISLGYMHNEFRYRTQSGGVWQPWVDLIVGDFIKSGSDAKAGLVPAPSTTAGTTKYLREDGTWTAPPDTINTAYCTCSTAAATAAKVITISGNTNWKLAAGSIINVKFSSTNTAQNPTFNVNSTGAKSVWYNTALITTSNLSYAGTANRPMQFVYDGTQFVFMGWSVDTNTTYTNAKLGQGYGTCSTEESTTTKVVSLSSYELATGGIVAVKFSNAVPASATLNINNKGAKPIYNRGAVIDAGVIKAGDIATFIYTGSQYHLLTVDRAILNTEITSSVEPDNQSIGEFWLSSY